MREAIEGEFQTIILGEEASSKSERAAFLDCGPRPATSRG